MRVLAQYGDVVAVEMKTSDLLRLLDTRQEKVTADYTRWIENPKTSPAALKLMSDEIYWLGERSEAIRNPVPMVEQTEMEKQAIDGKAHFVVLNATWFHREHTLDTAFEYVNKPGAYHVFYVPHPLSDGLAWEAGNYHGDDRTILTVDAVDITGLVRSLLEKRQKTRKNQ